LKARLDPARYRMLGQTGIRVSPLGLGTVKFGRNTGVRYPSGFDLPSDRDIEELLDLSREAGINLLDTAPAYGTAEARLGKLLRVREDWVISTKVGERYEAGTSTFDFSAAATHASIEQSLRRLHTDYLDIVFVHSDGNDLKIIDETDVLETLEAHKAAGRIRAIGVSTKTVDGGLRALEVADAVMVAWHPDDQSQAPVLGRAAERKKGVLVKKALASGHAADPAASLRFVLGHATVTAAVIGSINPRHVEANIAAVALL